MATCYEDGSGVHMKGDAVSRRFAWTQHPLFRFLASTRLAIVLIVLIAGGLVSGSIVDVRTSHRVAMHAVYGAVWFQLLLGVFALNLICCTLKAAPYRLAHLGFLVTHVSLLLVLAAAMLTANFGIRGTVRIVEGERMDYYFDPALLRCADATSARAVNIPTVFETRADLLQERYDGVVHVHAGRLPGVSILVDRYYPDASPVGESTVTIAIPGQRIRQVIPAVADPDTRVSIEGTDWAITIERTFYDWKDGREAGGPEQAGNPAARVIVHRPGGDVALTLFSRFPGFSTQPEPGQPGFTATYRFLPESPLMRGWRAENPAVRVNLSDDEGNRRTIWVRSRERAEVPLGNRRLVVEYPRRVPLGFGLVLREFVAKRYPHSNIPAAYESHLMVQRPSGQEQPAVIAMNAPARIGGFRLYQSSHGFDPKSRRRYTVLSLSRDPGAPVLYVGFAMLIAGLIVSFYLRPYLRRRRRGRREEAS